MSPEEPREPRRYLPADPAPPRTEPDGPNVRPTPAERFDAWDRAEDAADDDHGRPLPPVRPPRMHEGIFGFIEVKPGEVDFPMSILWGFVYFFAAFVACLVFLLLAQVVPVIIAFAGGLAYMWATGQNFAADNGKALTQLILMPSLALAQIITILVSVVALMLMLGWHWPRRVGLRLPSVWHLVLTFLIVPALILLANGAYALARRFLPGISDLGLPGMEEMVRVFGTWPWVLAVLIIGLGPGIGEELWCRGFLGLGLFGRNGIVARVFVASLFFGLIHGDPRQGTMAMLMGLFLHYVYLTTRSLFMPMLVHTLNNSVSVLAARFELVNVIDQEPEQIPLVFYAAAGVLLVCILVSLWRTHARLTSERPFEAVLWQPTYPGVEHPPPGCGVVVAYPRPDLVDLGLVALGVGTVTCSIAWVVLFG
jgi:membrane protease YdiL (CAAX protease family)